MNIVLIEDDLLFALNIKLMLEQIGYQSIVHFTTISDANTYLLLNKVDVIISDVYLNDGNCFQLKEAIKEIATIFMTSVENTETQERTLSYPKSFFLIKPFHELTLKAIIDRIKLEKGDKSLGIEVIGKHRQKKIIPFNEILWVETDGNYSTINCLDKKHTIKASMPSVMKQVPSTIIQVHKSFALNIKMINRIDLGQSTVIVNGNKIPIGRKYRSNFLQNIEV